MFEHQRNPFLLAAYRYS